MMIPVTRNRSAIFVTPIDRYIAVEVYIAVKRCRITGYIGGWTIGGHRQRDHAGCKIKPDVIVSVLSVPLTALLTLGRVSLGAVLGAAFGGVIAGLVLITLANIQWNTQKTAYWAKRTHEELRRQNKVK